MISPSDLHELNRQIRLLKAAAQGLDALADEFPAVKRNTARILSSIKMMEINVPDLVEQVESEDLGQPYSVFTPDQVLIERRRSL